MIWEPLQQMNISWPNGKRFAFSIVDDTDDATVENVRPIYDLLAECGLRTTKTVWPLRPIRSSSLAETLEDSTYRNWIEKLQDDGFEIGFHARPMKPPCERSSFERLISTGMSWAMIRESTRTISANGRAFIGEDNGSMA